MTIFEYIDYNKPYFLEEFFYNNMIHKLYLYKSFFSDAQKDQYFLKIFHLTEKKEIICEGYIYFYVDIPTKTTSFIGAYIKPEYRGNGLSSFLYAYWINFCLDKDIIHFDTNPKQRKPFLIYNLKKFTFEIINPDYYNKSPYTINICAKENDRTKYLYFHNQEFGKVFSKGKIMQNDNYALLNDISADTLVLDDVLLSTPYFMQDENKAYKRSLQIQERFR